MTDALTEGATGGGSTADSATNLIQKTAHRILPMAVIVLAVLAAACDPGMQLTVVNNSAKPVVVDEGDPQAWHCELAPWEEVTFTILGLDDKRPVVFIRAVDGTILHRNTLTIGELRERDSRLVIGPDVPGDFEQAECP